MKDFLSICQILVAVLLIVFILLQQRGTALGSAFGSEGSFYSTQRGLQKKLFLATWVLLVVFIVLALSGILFSK